MEARHATEAIAVAGVVIVGCLIANLTSDFLVDLIWFATVGYRDVFWMIFGTEVVLFFTVFVGSTVLF